MALQQPVVNPSVPYNGPILGGLREGQMILIQGCVLFPARRFAVNLVCANGDIAFHFNPRFDEGQVIVCNTKENGCWGPEERTPYVPFQPSVYFEVMFNIKSHGYQVSVHGQHLLEYRHRISIHLVQSLQINGDVSLSCINFAGGLYPPSYLPPPYDYAAAMNGQSLGGPYFRARHISPRRKSKIGMTVCNPAVPFIAALLGRFAQFCKITITGMVPFHADRFHVNLKNSLTGNIALHINPRMKEGTLVRNSHINGIWGPEERTISTVPFYPGQAFHMEITHQGNCYRVTVNGQVKFQYVHRIPPSQVDQLEIAGDVNLSCVQY